jgi:hypothetical protein
MVFEQEFHALGGVGAELIGSAADWLEAAFTGRRLIEGVHQDYIARDGRIGSGGGIPPWWSNEAPVRAVTTSV